jgi:uncharacterized protein YuzE
MLTGPDGRYVLSGHFDAKQTRRARTEEVAPGSMLDFDKDGRVIGIEMLSVSTLPGAKPMQMGFEILTSSDAAAAE